jgi:NADH-quinone oxidoreductase subunit C
VTDPAELTGLAGLAALAEHVRVRYPDVLEARGEVSVIVAREDLLAAMEWLRTDPELWFDALSDVAGTDWPGRDPRLWVAYHLYSTRHRWRVRVKVGLPEDDPHVPSVAAAYPTADWHEREVYDFFGVIFDGHPDLRRIQLPDEWTTFPLRKDHPLAGVATRYHDGRFIPPPDERGT